MFKSVKKVLVGVLAASLMLSSVVCAADVSSNTVAPKATVYEKKTVKTVTGAEAELAKTVKTVKAVDKTVKTLTVAGKTTFAKNAFKNANKKLTINVTKKAVFKKGAFAKNSKKMTIVVKGANKKALKTIKANLKKAGFKGTVKAAK